MQSLLVVGLMWALVSVPALSTAQTNAQDVQLHRFEQQLAQGPPLRFEDARSEALARDPQLAELKAQIVAATQRVTETQFLDPPMVEGEIWQWPLASLNPSRVDMYMLSVSQEFPGRGKRALRRSVLQNDVALVETQMEARRRQLEGDLRAAYIEVFTIRRVIQIHLATLPLFQQAVAASQVRYESGAISQADVLEGMVSVSKLHDDLIVLDQEHQLALARLNTLMLRNPDSAIGPLDDVIEPPALLPLADLERVALERHPNLAEPRTLRRRAEAMETEARADLKPDLRVSGGFMLRPREGDAWMASLGLTWPKAPWARGKVDARVAEARAEADAAGAKAAAAAAAISLELRESYIKADTTRQRLMLLRSTILPQSQQAIAIASVAYQADKVDFQTVLAQQRMLFETQMSYARAVGDAAKAIADLERVVGANVTVTASAATR